MNLKSRIERILKTGDYIQLSENSWAIMTKGGKAILKLDGNLLVITFDNPTKAIQKGIPCSTTGIKTFASVNEEHFVAEFFDYLDEIWTKDLHHDLRS